MKAKQFPEKWAVADTREATLFIKKLCDKGSHNACGYGFSSQNYNMGYLVFTSGKNDLRCYENIPDGYTEVTLSDLIAHYEPTTHPKWMPLTRGGYEYKIYEEVGELLFGSLKMINGTFIPTTWKLNGGWGNKEYDLIPYNPRIAELEEKITSKRSELAELEGELKELKEK